MDNFSDKTKSLLVELKEEHIQEQEEVLSEDNAKDIENVVEKPAVKETSEHEQIFSDKKPVKKKKKNVKFEVVENEIIREEQGQPTQPKQEQGQLPMTYRQKKKAEKDAIKAEQKRLKEIEKQKRREETAERNRQKARDRYWKEKEKKEKEQQQIQNEIPQKIVQQSKSKLNNFQKQEVKQKLNNNMDFYQFASYMSQYENLKNQYQQEKENKKRILREQQEQKQKQEALERKQQRERTIPFAHQFRKNTGMPNMFI